MTDQQCIAIIAALFKATDAIGSGLYDIEKRVADDAHRWGDWKYRTDDDFIKWARNFYDSVSAFQRPHHRAGRVSPEED